MVSYRMHPHVSPPMSMSDWRPDYYSAAAGGGKKSIDYYSLPTCIIHQHVQHAKRKHRRDYPHKIGQIEHIYNHRKGEGHAHRPCGSDGEAERRTWRPEAMGARVGLGFEGGDAAEEIGREAEEGEHGRWEMRRTRTHWARRAGAGGRWGARRQ